MRRWAYVVRADPYLNMDAGTMSPFEHGEVFVLDDGGEVSLLALWSATLESESAARKYNTFMQHECS